MCCMRLYAVGFGLSSSSTMQRRKLFSFVCMLFYALHALIASLEQHAFTVTNAGKAQFCIFITRCFVNSQQRRPTQDNNNNNAFNARILHCTSKQNVKKSLNLNENWSTTMHMFVKLNCTEQNFVRFTRCYFIYGRAAKSDTHKSDAKTMR